MARAFDGSGDYIIFTKSPAATDLSALTYSFNLTRNSGGANRNPFWSGGSFADNYHSFLQYDNGLSKLAFVANWTGAEARWSIPNTADDAAWHNHIISYDFGATTNDPVWYIDGISQTVTEVVTPSGSASFAADDGTLTLGAYDDGSAEYWDGKMAEFAIWNRILSSDEATFIGNGKSPSHIANGLVFYAPLSGRFGPEREIINGTTGVITNAVHSPHPPNIVYPFHERTLQSVNNLPRITRRNFGRELKGRMAPFS